MAVEKLYKLPGERDRSFWRLPEGAVITSVVLPPAPQGRRSVYKKGMARAAWSFALAGIAVSVDGVKSGSEARVALSGIAPIPVRVSDAERYLLEKGLAGADPDEFCRLTVERARPLSQNGYKVALLKGLAAEALRELSADKG
jgi:xanthine dehydrogenase YagS FAD-binding subunit